MFKGTELPITSNIFNEENGLRSLLNPISAIPWFQWFHASVTEMKTSPPVFNLVRQHTWGLFQHRLMM